jgi:tetratricopeptide (TPR) repeat protein
MTTITNRVAALLLFAVASFFSFAQAGAQQPDSVVTQLLNQGYALRRAGQTDSAAHIFARALALDSSNVRVARELGFAQLAAGDTLGARNTFRHIVRLAPGVRDDQAQLGYLDLALGAVPDAIVAFEGATRAAPNDAPLHLQLAYTYESAGNHVAAMHAFQDAARVGDTAVRRRARASLSVLAGEGYAQPGTVINDWYGAAQYGTHFRDFIVSAQDHAALSLDAATRTQAYVVGRVIRDSRTRGGEQPVIYSDNYANVGLGLRSRPLPLNLTIYGEAGPTATLTRGGASTVDWRAGLTFGSAWKSSHSHWFGESYADVSYYSRYDEPIGYAQFRQLRPISNATSWLDVAFHEGLVADGRGIGYNNLADGAAGVRVHGGPNAIGALYLEYVQSVYTTGQLVAGRRTFGEVRATFVASGTAVFLRR